MALGGTAVGDTAVGAVCADAVFLLNARKGMLAAPTVVALISCLRFLGCR